MKYILDQEVLTRFRFFPKKKKKSLNLVKDKRQLKKIEQRGDVHFATLLKGA